MIAHSSALLVSWQTEEDSGGSEMLGLNLEGSFSKHDVLEMLIPCLTPSKEKR